MKAVLFRRAVCAVLLVLMVAGACACDTRVTAPAEELPSPTPVPVLPEPSLPEGEQAGLPSVDAEIWYEPYAPIITVSTAWVVDPSRTYPSGNTWDNNVWTRAYEELLGIRLTYKWTGEVFQLPDAIGAMAAADDLPDYMVLPYDSFSYLASRGMLEALDAAVETYAHDDVREALDAYGGAAREVASMRGQLQGLMSAPPRDGPMLWYRDDWLEAAGGRKPATFEELLDLMRFLSNDPLSIGTKTYGLALSEALFAGEYGRPMGLDGFFSAYGAYPTQWQEVSGELMHGSVSTGARQALAELQSLVHDGVIDPDFAEQNAWTDGLTSLYEGEVGLVMGWSWFAEWLENSRGAYPRTVETETWSCMPIPGMSGTPNAVPTAARVGDVTCIRAGFAYPEVAVKMVNLTQGLLEGDIAQPQFTSIAAENYNIPTAFMSMAVGGCMSDGRRGEYAAKVVGALDGAQNGLEGDARILYQRCLAYRDEGDMSAYGIYSQYGPGGSQSVLADMRARGMMMPDAYYGPSTVNMVQDTIPLNEARDDAYRRIMTGEDVDKVFEEYVRFFSENGGREMTREVNDWYAAR